MRRLYASYSSEYFAVREPSRLFIYRDSFLSLTHRVADQVAGELIHLADNGDCFFRSSEGLFRLRLEKNVRADRCRATSTLDGSADGGVLGGVELRADGEQIAYEQIVPAQKFTSKLKRFLGQKSSQGDVGPTLHRFILSGWSGRSSSSYYETVVDPRTSAGLVWWMAPDFGFLSMLERGRDGRSLLRVIDVLHESVVNELVVDGKLSRDRAITANGTVGFGLEKEGRRAFIVWTYSQERHLISYPKDARMLHLAKDCVAFIHRAQHRLIVKSFHNQIIADVNLSTLAKLGIDYLVNFNPRGSIELLTHQHGKLRVHHTDLSQLPTDARRWELLGEQQRAERIEHETEALLAQRYGDDTQDRLEEQRQQLAQEVDSYSTDGFGRPQVVQNLPSLAPVESSALELERISPLEVEVSDRGTAVGQPSQTLRFASKDEAQSALERLRMSYIAGELRREDYFNEKASIERELVMLDDKAEPPDRASDSGEKTFRTLSISSE